MGESAPELDHLYGAHVDRHDECSMCVLEAERDRLKAEHGKLLNTCRVASLFIERVLREDAQVSTAEAKTVAAIINEATGKEVQDG